MVVFPTRTTLTTLTGLTLLAIGCQSDSVERGHAEDPTDEPPRESTMTTSPADSLLFQIHAPAEVQEGQSVPITLRLRNAGPEPAVRYFRGRDITFDIVVTRVDGSAVWRRLAGAAIPAIVQVRRLEPGEQLEFKDQWRQRTDRGQPVSPGSYLLHGILLTDAPEALETPRVPLRVLPHR
jgi:Intracellular proteinase inhibitor